MNSFGIISLVLLSTVDDITTDKLLLNAIKFGNVGIAVHLIRSGLGENDLEECNENGETPLWLALHEKYENLALLLIKSGANVNAVWELNHHLSRRYQTYPLHAAACNHLASCVSALIAKGASVNKKDGEGCTPLMVTAQDTSGKYNADIARILLNAGADINEPEFTYYDETHPPRPLHHAACNGNAAVIELLLSKGANVNEMGGIYLRKAPIDYVMFYECSLWASYEKAKDTAIILLNNGADRTEMNDFRKILKTFWTPAHSELETGTYDNFDDFLLNISAKVAEMPMFPSKERNVETFSLMKYLRNGFLEIGMYFHYKFSITGKILSSVREFHKQGMFALYRLLKTCYDASRHGTRSSVLESLKLDIFDYVSNGVSKRTYFDKISVDLMADVLYEAGYYGWKIERLAWNVALAVYPYRLNININRIGGEIAFNLLLESEKDL